MAFLSANGADLHFEIHGDGTAQGWVTLINGYTRPLADFHSFARFLSERGWGVLLLDNRGAGLTRSEGEFTLAQLADDVYEVWRKEKIVRSHVLGISFGGTIAVHLASRHADKVGKLVLVSMPLERSVLRIREDHPSLPADQLEKDLRRYFSPNFLIKNELFVRGFVRQMQRLFSDGNAATGAIRQRAAIRHLNLREMLLQLTVPAMVLHGTADEIVPYESAKTTAELLAKGTLQPLAGAGHLLLVERPKELMAMVHEFLAFQD